MLQVGLGFISVSKQASLNNVSLCSALSGRYTCRVIQIKMS